MIARQAGYWGVEAYVAHVHTDRRILVLLVADDGVTITGTMDLKPSEARQMASALLREAERAEGQGALRTAFEVLPAQAAGRA